MKLISLEQSGTYGILVEFDRVPYSYSSTNTNDALRVANYTVTRNSVNKTVSSVSIVPGYPRKYLLTLAAAIEDGNYLVTVSYVEAARTLVNEAVDVVQAPTNSLSLYCVPIAFDSSLANLPNRTNESDLQSYLGPVFRGPNWNALIQSIAGNRQFNEDYGSYAMDQLYISTASGKYLAQRGADYGVKQPASIGMADDTFRKYVLTMTNNKLTDQSVWSLLEVFYGTAKVSAYKDCLPVTSGQYSLTGSKSIRLLIDGQDQIVITFKQSEVGSSPSVETVAYVITRQCALLGVGAYAIPYKNGDGDPLVRIFSSSRGLRSKIEVVSGYANWWTNLLANTNEVRTIYSDGIYTPVCAQTRDGLNIVLPATTPVTDRSLDASWFLYEDTSKTGSGGYLFAPYPVDGQVYYALTAQAARNSNPIYPLSSTNYLQYVTLGGSNGLVDLPNTEGYILIGYGYDYQTGPIKYYGTTTLSSVNYLVIDGNFVFPTKIPANATIQYMADKAPYSALSLEDGSAWVADVSTARTVAIDAIRSILPAGVEVNFDVIYPTDTGLYNWDLPTEGAPVLSSVVEVYGGNNLDAELAQLREGI
jgi:hypothetical protein